MHKVILGGALLAATLAPVAAQAQSPAQQRHEWREDRRDRRHDRREDRREDWQRNREAHRDWYRGGGWRAPFAYRAFGVGVAVPRAYWGPRNYVNDWARFRLPPPGPYYRYVRHYHDVLLIDIRDGRVARVYRSFYW